MKQQNITGFIVRINQAKDADLLLQIVTNKGSLVTGYAKGARKPLSRKSFAIDLLNLIVAKVEQKGELYFIDEVRLMESVRNKITSLDGLMALQALCELASKFALFAEESAQLYLDLHAAANCLRLNDNAAVLAAFMLKLLNLQGVLPELKLDSATQQPISVYYGYNPHEVGYSDGSGRLIDERIVKSQLFLTRASFADAVKLALQPAEQKLLLEITSGWVALYLGNEVKSISSYINL